MTENIKRWLRDMYQSEIEEINSMIANENLWMTATDDADSLIMLNNNVQEHMLYKTTLENLMKEIENKF